MSSAGSLLASSEATLAGTAPDRNRMACWLARSALEAVVVELLDARGYGAREATMRSRLTCLQVAYRQSPAIPARAHFAWARLSEACHQHAYRLSPTYTEARHLIDVVRSLVAEVSPPESRSSAGSARGGPTAGSAS